MSEWELIPEEGVAGKYISTALDENGVLQKIDFHNRSFRSWMDIGIMTGMIWRSHR